MILRKKQIHTWLKKQLAEVEEEIARLEATMKMYEVQLANPVVQQDLEEMENISKQLQRRKAIYESCMRNGNIFQNY